ncbi:xanthine dehydrogenase family protein molybdopterin-binding subunit [Thalassobaculum sp. OXR-137]|uniref:xanthine dehydrogenase family protein molybdopterin-binding subunit n=1 Tax=Thalassobaculum sp. OXR-137 TaxID=3100173 RepID=UPI002AC9757D|nr:xanthine dehydrogenase family protein molybdopterin-binding subunit [Thalassobaculum sp. OXR-137]WPZ34670.1 xanthine dehydrogenase family protein molybdopterin-binding subunit [Thalassobaculum sp. OXR-137]
MNVLHESDLATLKFGVGQPVPRGEDPTLLTGRGEYTDDVNLDGQAYGYVVRSQVPHGVIKGIDLDDALAMPGVLAIYTAKDLTGFGGIPCVVPFKNRDGSDMHKPLRPGLAGDVVRFVGDPVAMVVAESQSQARDAAEMVMLDIDELPAVTDPVEAAKDGAPQLYADVPNNVCLDYHYGDAEAAEKAFAGAAHVTKLTLVNNRVVVASMEPRSAIASYDPAEEKYTFIAGSQGAFGLRNALANAVLKVPAEKVRVITKNVGGSFGMKGGPYPEYFPLLHAAKQLGRPVKWVDDRSGAFVSDHQGRGHVVDAAMAFDKDGHILALRADIHADMGAYLSPVGPQPATLNAVKNLISVYQTPVIDVNSKCVLTNTTTIGPYRGAGRPEANYYVERLLDTAAAEMGIDRLEIRRRNQIRADQIPYTAPSGMTYDSGDFPAVFDKAVTFSDWDGFAARKAESEARGKLRGIGMSDYLEVTGPQGKEMGGLRFEEDGTVTIITGTLDYGQGHWTAFAQVLHQRTGIPFDRIRLLQGDSDELIVGGGTGGSKSMMSSGGAIIEAGDVMIENGKKIAAHVLETAVADIEFAEGTFTVAGTDRSVGVMDLAEQIRSGLELPEDVPQSLDVSLAHETGPSAFPNGCHVAEVEIDPDTGHVAVVRYSMVNDFGVVVNPMLVEGQAHGGIVQGIGQALMEQVRYDESGQLITGSFMDYALPRAEEAPMFRYDSHPVPCTTNLVGAKGCGEAGCAGALASVMNAVVDALGGKHIDMPATPERVWRALHS